MFYQTETNQHHVVIIGGGFGGLYAAKALGKTDVRITLVDKRNFHLFQPLLYQIAIGGLSPGDIASPLRAVLRKYKNIEVIKAEVIDLDPEHRRITFRDGELNYDSLIVATGSTYNYFGHDEWAEIAPGIKTIENTLDIRHRIFLAFEAAEREADIAQQKSWMRFVIIGAGPTGVELAGAIGELAQSTLRNDFRHIDTCETEIILLEGTDRILPTYPEELSIKAQESLERLGITVNKNAMVTGIKKSFVTFSKDGKEETIQAKTILWAAGVKASSLGEVLARRTGGKLDSAGRVIVEPDLSIPGFDNIFVIGDLANFSHEDGRPLPGVAPVAMQEGLYVAKLLESRFRGRNLPPFKYKNKGSLAVIGRNAAVADFGRFRFSGFFAWLIWIFIHIQYLIEFDNKVLVLIQWAWNYFTRKRGARLITGEDTKVLSEK
ncbi:MAG TPA: NAD(P)/FAD-dependent oxidoreductase [Thermodesulfobacteriota bacterium]